MYAEADRVTAQEQLRRRWMITIIPAAVLMATGVIVFSICQNQRQDWGWIFACAMTILGGGYFLFLLGVYLLPMKAYAKHIGYMLTGRMRKTEGRLTDVSDETVDRDGLDWYAITVNIGENAFSEDDRLLYYDALKSRPDIPIGTQVKIFSNDKMISDIRKA